MLLESLSFRVVGIPFHEAHGGGGREDIGHDPTISAAIVVEATQIYTVLVFHADTGGR